MRMKIQMKMTMTLDCQPHHHKNVSGKGVAEMMVITLQLRGGYKQIR